MKILIATPIYPPEIGGPATYTKELCKHFASFHDITVVAYTNTNKSFPDTKLISVNKQKPLIIRLIKYFLEILKIARKMDVIYVQNAMAAGLPVALASMFSGVPFVLKFVGDEAWERAAQLRLTKKRLEEFLAKPERNIRIRIMMIIQRFVLRRAAKVITPSNYLREEIIKTYKVSPSRIVVNYNAADDNEVLPFQTKRIQHQIVTTARLVAWKGIDGIIKAVAILKNKFPDIKLVVAGEGPEMNHLQSLAREKGISDHVTFLGNVSRAETWHLRKNSEVYVLNSTYEGLPHTVLTSFAAMIPVVATNISGTNEAIYHEKTGLLVEPNNEKELAEAITRLFEEPELGEKLTKNGAILLKEKFSWEAHLKNLLSVLESVAVNPVR